MIYVIGILCLASFTLAAKMVTAERAKKDMDILLNKVFASIFFVAAGFLAVGQTPDTTKLIILAGLVLGMLGDIFLSHSHIFDEAYWERLLTIGGGFFLVGHLCYYMAFMQVLDGAPPRYFWFALAAPIAVLLLLKMGFWKNVKGIGGYLVYGLVSGLLVCGGVDIVLHQASAANVVLLLAAITFVFSDVALGTYNYSKFRIWPMRFTCILAYYLAQILFVIGILLL